MQANAYCTFCGNAFPEGKTFPQTCSSCSRTTYLNPVPVVVVVLPVGEGVLVIRRGLEDGMGQLAFPGGFLEQGESWQEGGARELWEETGIQVEPDSLTPYAVRSTPRGDFLLLFALAHAISSEALPPFVPTPEVTERIVLTQSARLAFPIHTEILEQYINQRAS